MTGLRGSELMSATGLKAQFIPAIFISRALALVVSAAREAEPDVPSAIAPGLVGLRGVTSHDARIYIQLCAGLITGWRCECGHKA